MKKHHAGPVRCVWCMCVCVFVCVYQVGQIIPKARQRFLITHSFVWILLWGHWHRLVSGTWTLNIWKGKIRHVVPGSQKRWVRWWDVCVCACAQSGLTLCNPMDSNLPGSSVQGIFKARILEWDALFHSRGSSWPKDQGCISCPGIEPASLVSPALVGWFFTTVSPGKPKGCDIKL